MWTVGHLAIRPESTSRRAPWVPRHGGLGTPLTLRLLSRAGARMQAQVQAFQALGQALNAFVHVCVLSPRWKGT